jgi:hypothetical protein
MQLQPQMERNIPSTKRNVGMRRQLEQLEQLEQQQQQQQPHFQCTCELQVSW